MSTTDVTAEVQEPIDAPVPETAEQVTEQPPAEEQAESVEQQQQQQQQPVVEQVETSASVAAAAGPAPPPVFAAANGVYSKPESWIPEEAEVSLAKAFLKSSTTNSDANLYNHLVTLVMRVLESRPANALDVFESLSADIKRNKFKVQQNNAPSSFKIVPQTSEELLLAQSRSKLFERLDSDDADEGEIPDLLEISKLWEWAGYSFGQEETFLLFLSLKKLAVEKSLKSVRVWGKILGLDSNYFVIEAELKDGASDEDEIAEPEEEVKEVAEPAADDSEIGKIPIPKMKTKVTVPVPKESRTGVNKYIYYVSTHAGSEWIRLPDVIPECLQVSRQIRKYFTGNLNKSINSYPVFKGNEAQLLRCQIARISASTVVSPAGYYAFDPEEEAGEDSERSSSIIINTEYEGAPNTQLLAPSNWVHHVPYILPQGRTVWENTSASVKKSEDGDDDEDAEKDGDAQETEEENNEPESGPAILSPLSGDDEFGDIASWSSRSCSNFLPSRFAPITLRSNRWPGAIVVAHNDKFTNVYIGDGQKNLGNPMQHFIVPKLPDIQVEYGADVLVENDDPTVEEEKAFEDSQKVKEEEVAEDGEPNDDGEEKEEEEED